MRQPHHDQLLKRWLELCHHIGVQRGHLYYVALYRHLTHYYNSPGRHYHNLEHIKNCLAKFDEIKHLLDEPDVVELSIWFHDAIYEVWANDNEDRSAELAMFFIIHLMGLPIELAGKVFYLIERTQYFSKDRVYKPETNDAKYLVDIDLFSGLGGSPHNFQKNSGLTGKEYAWVDTDAFLKKRLEIFIMFWCRSPFYLTDYFRERYEEQTKANLEGAIKELERQILPSKALSSVTNPIEEKDRCVICGKETPYTKNTHIDSRNYYVEGCGQLCGDCWFKNYSRA